MNQIIMEVFNKYTVQLTLSVRLNSIIQYVDKFLFEAKVTYLGCCLLYVEREVASLHALASIKNRIFFMYQ